MKVSKSLVEMAMGEEGLVAGIEGGFGLTRRLDAIGIRPGVKLQKMSGPYLQGPVTVRVGNAQIAVGFGMASRIVLETEEKEE